MTQLGGAGVRPLGAGTAILNCLYGVQLIFSEDMARAFARALNDWIAKEWLDRDPRLRASIVVPMQNVEYAVDEIERCAKDKRFVQILVLAMQETPLGRRQNWPIFAAAEKHGLPIGIHAGSNYRNPVTSLGWPSHYVEDYTSQSQGFQAQVASLITEGAFAKYPKLKVVLIESGVTWLPAVPVAVLEILARGAHRSAVGRPVAVGNRARQFPPDHPAVRRPVRPGRRGTHHRTPAFGRNAAVFLGFSPLAVRRGRNLPRGIPEGLRRKILVENPLATYDRLNASRRRLAP